jgi:carboxylate-amine ligase
MADVGGHRYGSSPPYRLGVEEELLLVDPVVYDLEWCCDRVIEHGRHSFGQACGEFSQAVLEHVTPICETADDAVQCLRALRTESVAAGATLLGAGLHPSAAFGDVRMNSSDRYDAIDSSVRGLMRRTPHCGVHIHVGMPDPDTAVRALNGMRRWLPLLQALATNAPYWHGIDSGLASARWSLLRSLPRSGIPRAFRDHEDHDRTIAEIVAAAELADYTFLWWDQRLHPRLGTLEVRAIDAQSSLDDLAALVALTHGLAIHEAVGDHPVDHPSPEALDETSFRAFRDGRDARLLFDGVVRPVSELAADAVQIARRYVEERPLEGVARIVREGNGADRQRLAMAAGGMPALLAALVAETVGQQRWQFGHVAEDGVTA